MVQNILRRPAVEALTGLSRSSIYALMAVGKFPRPVPLAGRAVGWLESDIAAFQERCIAERDGAAETAPAGESA